MFFFLNELSPYRQIPVVMIQKRYTFIQVLDACDTLITRDDNEIITERIFRIEMIENKPESWQESFLGHRRPPCCFVFLEFYACVILWWHSMTSLNLLRKPKLFPFLCSFIHALILSFIQSFFIYFFSSFLLSLFISFSLIHSFFCSFFLSFIHFSSFFLFFLPSFFLVYKVVSL